MSRYKLSPVCIALIVIVGIGVTPASAQQESVAEAVATRIDMMLTLDDGPDDITIRVASPLDEPRFYCVDIPGNNEQFDGVEMSLHTCKDGMTHRDTIFSASRAAEGELFMPDYDLCLAAYILEKGAPIQLGACTGDSVQWQVGSSRITPAGDSELCLTVGAEPGALTRGGKTYPTRYKSRPLILDSCDEDIGERQGWMLVEPRKDLAGPILPDGTLADISEFERIFGESIRAARGNGRN